MIRKFKLQIKKKEELEPEEILLDAKQKEMEERASWILHMTPMMKNMAGQRLTMR